MHGRIRIALLLHVAEGREAALRVHSVGYQSWGLLRDVGIAI